MTKIHRTRALFCDMLNLPRGKYVPSSEMPQNFGEPVVYVVTSADGSQNQYTVLTFDLDNDTTISSFDFINIDNTALDRTYIGEIDALNLQVTIRLKYGLDVTKLIPKIVVPNGASISPDSNTVQDFTEPITYTVTAEDGSSIKHVVTVLKPTVSQRDALVAYYNANPGHSLNWDISSEDFSSWNGVVIKENNVVGLNLGITNNNKPTIFPPEIGDLIFLESISANGIMLQNLPKEIENLKNLKEFSINFNELTELPIEIGLLTNLRELIIDNNKLVRLPSEIANLAFLNTLDVRGMPLEFIPEVICKKEATGLIIRKDDTVPCK